MRIKKARRDELEMLKIVMENAMMVVKTLTGVASVGRVHYTPSVFQERKNLLGSRNRVKERDTNSVFSLKVLFH